MNKVLAFSAALLILSSVVFSACGHEQESFEGGSLYVMNNSPSENSVLVYERQQDGTLLSLGSYGTQGKGSGSSLNPLGSQGALALSADGKWLAAVNAGSNEVSLMRVSADGLKLASITSSLGQYPVSLAFAGNRVFLLNQKSMPPAVNQFSMDKNGVLTAVSGATRLLPPAVYSQVAVSPNGKWLVISGETNNVLLVYAINGAGVSSDPVTVESSGRGPAGMAFDRSGNLLVTEVSDNSVSSYAVSGDGLKAISASVAAGQKSPSWITVIGDFAYVSYAGAGNISVFGISASPGGQLSLISTTTAGSAVSELAASSDGKYLYALDPVSRAVAAFAVGSDGALTAGPSTGALFGIAVQGIAAS